MPSAWLPAIGKGTIVSAKWSTPKRCYCKDSSGRELGRTCPKLDRRHHGIYGYDTRIPSSRGRRELRRFGFATQKEAGNAAALVWELIGLGRDDARTQARIGGEIFKRTSHGGELPSVEDVRRRLGLGRPLDSSETFGEAWAAWLAGKRKARPSYANSLAQIGRNWLLPVLADVALDRVNGEHCAMVFERIEMFNEEIEAARAGKRAPVLPGDVRERAKLVGVATQHRVYAALRVFLNHAWKRRHVIPFNPVYAVELEPETRDAPLVWDAGQVGQFLAHTADDRLHFLWRLALVRGFRRGELAGMADDDFDAAEATVTVNVALLQIGGRLVWGKPKSKAGERVVDLDRGSVVSGKAHRSARRRERLAAGSAWEDSGRMFTREDGSPLSPDWISKRFKELAAAAGLPVIKFHAARHTAASLMFDADVDVKIVQEVLGHSTERITRDIYTHVRRQKHQAAAERTVALLPVPPAARETGS
jgi:integrase